MYAQEHNPIKESLFPLTQNVIEGELGAKSLTMCFLTAVLNQAHFMGYTPHTPDVDPLSLTSRAQVSRIIRQMGIPVISWHTAATGQLFDENSIQRMQEAGYIGNGPQDRDFLNTHAATVGKGAKGIMELIDGGYLLTVSVLPNFGENGSVHALTVHGQNPSTGLYDYFDCDPRNRQTACSQEHLFSHIAPLGAATYIPPANNQSN